MPRRRSFPTAGAGVVACLAAALSACGTGAVTVETRDLTGAAARTCRALLEALPATVDGQPRREVEPGDAYAAAWGDPATVLRCGVAPHPEFDDFAACQETNGVGWFVPEDQISGEPEPITMTTIGRTQNVEVRLPPDRWPPANTMVDLAEAIKATLPEVDPCV
jgi:hypothetical protein